ncbi:MAG TPA: hypothetical protein VEC12_15175 [Bacteroidia bacterium]|nr:hypothetical protein [Bacteroidia bacterium]
MKPGIVFFICFAIYSTAFAQTGNVGVGTATPGSKLTVNGSFAAAYRMVTASYTMTVDDHYVVSNSASNSTITLPAALPVGSGNFKGRLYEIKNTHTTSTLAVTGNGAELIDDVGATGVSNITLSPGYGILLVSTGATSGIAWEVVSYHRTTPAPLPSPSQSIIAAIPAGTYSNFFSSQTVVLQAGVYYVAPYNSNINSVTSTNSANYYGYFNVQFVSGSGTSGSQVFHWSSLYTNMFTQPGFILRITSPTAEVRARLSHGVAGNTFTSNGAAQFTLSFQKMD